MPAAHAYGALWGTERCGWRFDCSAGSMSAALNDRFRPPSELEPTTPFALLGPGRLLALGSALLAGAMLPLAGPDVVTPACAFVRSTRSRSSRTFDPVTSFLIGAAI